jgi:membrane protein
MPAIVKPDWLTWKEVAKRTWARANEDDVFGRAAQLAYYFLLALFPLMIFLIAVLGLFASTGEHLRAGLFQYLNQTLPASAYVLVQKTLDEIIRSSGGGKISLGLILSIWSASAGMLAIMDTLNVAYGVREGRSFIKLHALAIGLTIAVAALMIAAVTLLLFGSYLVKVLPLGGAMTLFWKFAQYPISIACALLVFALIYYAAPDVEQRRWHWITPGSIVGVALWLLASLALRVYLHFFNNYSATYGSLGAVIILLLWFYLSGVAILLGAEVNVVLENAAAESGIEDAKLKGEKTPGSLRQHEPATGFGTPHPGPAHRDAHRHA